MLNIGNFVYVINQNKELYRRRCRITKIDEDGETVKYLVYSEGLEEDEWMLEEDVELSKY